MFATAPSFLASPARNPRFLAVFAGPLRGGIPQTLSPASLSRGPLDLRQNVLTLHITEKFSPLDDPRFAPIMPAEIATSRRPLSDRPTTANDPRPDHRNLDRSRSHAATT